jgi:hypothetical protein
MEEGELTHLSCVITRLLTDVFNVSLSLSPSLSLPLSLSLSLSLSLFYLFLSALVKDYFAGSLEGKVRVSS